VKAGVEQAKGFRPAEQELFRYDEAWTGTKGSGGSGHSAAQEDAALVEEGYEFEGPCSLMVSVNESYAVVLEGQEEGEVRHAHMGVYERIEDTEVNGRGVWQAVGGFNRFLSYYSSKKEWCVSSREHMEDGSGKSVMRVKSTTTTPDQINEYWVVYDGTGWVSAPKLRARVCSSVEKHAAEQCVEQQHEQALEQAQLSHQLVVEGLANDRKRLMGVYELLQGKVVNHKAVWQKQSGGEQRFLYFSRNNSWVVSSKREHMEAGSSKCLMKLNTKALTPDQTRTSDVWRVSDAAEFVDAPEVRVQRRI
jgi:hypothetical protein